MNDNVVRLFTLDIEKLKDENLLLKKRIGASTALNVILVAGVAFMVVGVIALDKRLDEEFEDINNRLDGLENS